MPAPTSLPLATTALILGCGFLGRRVATRLIAQGVCVYGTTRSHQNAARLAHLGVRPMIVSVDQSVTLAAIRPAVESPDLDLYYLVPPIPPTPETPDATLQGLRHVLTALHPAQLRRAVMTSSTAVYGQTGGVPVNADTPPHPTGDRARLLLEAEQIFLAAGPAFHVVRLSGLYGPGRVVGLDAVRDGAPLVGDPQALLNLIHVDDAADLLIALMRSPAPARVELGCDGHPVPRQAYYNHLAQMLGVAPPAVLSDQTAAVTLGLDAQRLARSSSKACDNTPTRLRTHWRPQFPDFRAGLEHAMSEL